METETYIRLLHEHKDRVYSNAIYMLRNQQDAEDATQEVFVRFWNHRDSLDPKLSGGWLMRTTNNLCIDLIRHRKTRNRALQKTDDINWRTVSDHTEKSINPLGRLELQDQQRELLAALDELPDQTRCMMLLYYFQGQNLQTIGEIFDRKIGTIKVTLHRGRQKLRALLEPATRTKKESGSYERIMR